MVSFQNKLAEGLKRREVGVAFSLEDEPYQAVLVIGGTRRLGGLWRARRKGKLVVQRLDGMNWLHRRMGFRKAGLRHYLRAELGNLLLAVIRRSLAERIIYQSQFVEGWWRRRRGETQAPSTVIYNGVSLEVYSPAGPERPPEDRYRILMVEGSLMGGYELGLGVAVEMAADLAGRMRPAHRLADRRIELVVAGRVAQDSRSHAEQRLAQLAPPEAAGLTWAGLLPPEAIPPLDRSAHLLYSADIHSACPNSVIEALACGLPVLSFDTGALPELVQGGAGLVVPYGGDPWKLAPPDVPALAQAASEILQQREAFSRMARRRAEAEFGLDKMVDAYLEVLF